MLALPARSPMPLIVPWIQRAPARTAATAPAVASPKSLWPRKRIGIPAPSHPRGPPLENRMDGALVVGGEAREAGLDPLDPELVEPTRDLELLLRIENDANRLLAVAERRVVEADLGVDRRVAVDLAGPDAVAHRKSSGKEESFSALSAVTRKLSSTRRPPPSGQ